MSERWFRVYVGLVDDPKVQRLPPPIFRALVNLWCLAATNGGPLPSLGDTAFKLRMSVEKTRHLLALLVTMKLIDQDDSGRLRPHNWDGRQFIAGENPERPATTSTDRVKRYRAKMKRVSSSVSPVSSSVSSSVSPVSSSVSLSVSPASELSVSAVSETPPESESESDKKNNTAALPRAKPAKHAGQIPLLLPVDGGGAGPEPKPDINALEARLREAAGESLNAVSTGLMILSDPLNWLKNGCSLEEDVLPTLRAVAARPSTRPGAVRTWNFFTAAVYEARDRRIAPAQAPAARAPPTIDIGSLHIQATQGNFDARQQRERPTSQAEAAVTAMAAALARRMADRGQR